MIERLIDPKTLARVKDMPLIAKTVADGFLHGLQTSRQRGVGIEFSQYRSYEPGDELSHIDWKLFARSDRYFVREAERESEMTLWLLVDASGSMAQRSLQSKRSQNSAAGHWDKLDYARHLAATLAYIGQKQGDNVGLLGLSAESLCFLPPAGGERHWLRLMAQLSGLKPGQRFPGPELLQAHAGRLQQPGMVVLISDFYQPNAEINRFLGSFCHGHNEVVALQLQSADELAFDYRGLIRFKDLESDEELLVSAATVKDNYLNALNAHQQALKARLGKLGIALTSLSIDEPMDAALFGYLKQRQKVRR